jgi:hypothetical protein
MELESFSPYPQEPATYPYPEPTASSPHDHLQLPEDPYQYYPPIYVLVYWKIHRSTKAQNLKRYMVWSAQTIQGFLVVTLCVNVRTVSNNMQQQLLYSLHMSYAFGL